MEARKSRGGVYKCKQPWDKSVFVQCGDSGLVIRSKENGGPYKTAFFEAFPKDPKTFIRGEGDSLESAELNAFVKYQKILNCEAHDFKRMSAKSRVGVCVHCNLKLSDYFPPVHKCKVCGKPEVSFYVSVENADKEGYLCEKHFIQEAKVLSNKFTVQDTERLILNEYSSTFEMLSVNVETYSYWLYLYLKFLNESELFDKSLPDYKKHDLLNEEIANFEEWSYKKIRTFIVKKKLDGVLQDDDFLSISISSILRDLLLIYPDLCEKLFFEFKLGVSQPGTDERFSEVLINLYEVAMSIINSKEESLK